MNGWANNVVTLSGSGAQSVGASAVKTPISREFNLSAGGATRGFVAKITLSGVTVATGVTAMLQSALGSDWVDSKTATVTTNGAVYIKILADSTYMPLLNKGRVVLTTGTGDAATVTAVEVLQEL